MKKSTNNGTAVGFFARPVGNFGISAGTNIVYTEVTTNQNPFVQRTSFCNYAN